MGVKCSACNGLRDPKCPSARRLHMVRKDTWPLSEGDTCAWMAADEAVGCTRVFLTMWKSSRLLVCRRRLDSGIHINGISESLFPSCESMLLQKSSNCLFRHLLFYKLTQFLTQGLLHGYTIR
ncbi:uncharacterized protein TNCV_4436471 [Trichonephila clavipes]|nr:uncharacterized protein TNCV_4436471 [Trichonephila clavipes]